jgi:hypothetical protein
LALSFVLADYPEHVRRVTMAKAQRVDINSITDLIRPVALKPEPAWKEFVSELEDLEPGGAVEFTPEGGESARAIMQKAARAAHSLGMNVRNYQTQRGTVVLEVLRGTWEPKSKEPRQEGEAPRPRGRPRKQRPEES